MPSGNTVQRHTERKKLSICCNEGGQKFPFNSGRERERERQRVTKSAGGERVSLAGSGRKEKFPWAFY